MFSVCLFVCLFVCFLAKPHGLQDLISPTRGGTRAPAVKALNPNYWTVREFPRICNFNKFGGNADAAGSQTTFEHHRHLDSLHRMIKLQSPQGPELTHSIHLSISSLCYRAWHVFTGHSAHVCQMGE